MKSISFLVTYTVDDQNRYPSDLPLLNEESMTGYYHRRLLDDLSRALMSGSLDPLERSGVPIRGVTITNSSVVDWDDVHLTEKKEEERGPDHRDR